MCLLAGRSWWVDEGGTVGMPGGGICAGESAYRVTEVQDCGGGWKFHFIRADVDEPFAAYSAKQAVSIGWFSLSEMKALRLHPACPGGAGIQPMTAAPR